MDVPILAQSCLNTVLLQTQHVHVAATYLSGLTLDMSDLCGLHSLLLHVFYSDSQRAVLGGSAPQRHLAVLVPAAIYRQVCVHRQLHEPLLRETGGEVERRAAERRADAH